MTAVIRKGESEDMPQVLEMIRELAEYEKALPEVSITVETLQKDGFGAQRYFDVLVAEKEQELVGFALYFSKYSTWKGKGIYLEDLLVRRQHRRAGIGGQLFEAMMTVAKEVGAQRLEWQVLDWNEPAIAFYKKYGASLDGEWLNGRLVEF